MGISPALAGEGSNNARTLGGTSAAAASYLTFLHEYKVQCDYDRPGRMPPCATEQCANNARPRKPGWRHPPRSADTSADVNEERSRALRDSSRPSIPVARRVRFLGYIRLGKKSRENSAFKSGEDKIAKFHGDIANAGLAGARFRFIPARFTSTRKRNSCPFRYHPMSAIGTFSGIARPVRRYRSIK